MTPTSLKPTHDEIALCAQELWMESGRPGGCDEAIWLAAEGRLISARTQPNLEAIIMQTLAQTSPGPTMKSPGSSPALK